MEVIEDHIRTKDARIKFAVQKKKLGTADAVKAGTLAVKRFK